ncbi:MAG: ATP synthase F1 subunit gamma [Candidatus Latescibacteria bacterium]|nr:ATP synthase F1 subunit gamma [Candidatus Latescibacterota bacterium]
MATLRQLRTRVGSVKNIQRVTNAMKLVAAAKMRKAQEAIAAARPYARQLDRILQRLTQSLESQHPLFRERPVQRVAVAVVTADRGLCGAFNSNVCRRAQVELRQYQEADLITVGRKGRDYFRRRGQAPVLHHADVFRPLSFNHALQISHDLGQRFLSGQVDRVLLVFSEFRSVARQQPVVEQLLPVVPKPAVVEEGKPLDYIFEPEPERLLDTLIPLHVNYQVWRALLECSAGEQAARMAAMDNATKNAGELIEGLVRQMNKKRQASITLELMDIIGGAEAVSQ